jgi:DNA adenine methylase
MPPKKPLFFSRPNRPFLRWAGGKQQLVDAILDRLPDGVWKTHTRLVEPFLGAGSVFFGSQPPKALLGDANPQLISCFEWVKKDPDRVWRYLDKFAQSRAVDHYYRIRDYYNGARHSARRAAAFLYLNGACFNGVFRVNEEGEFNVPVGRRDRLVLPSLEHLRKCAATLKKATLRAADFEDMMELTKPGDLVFLDPPYPALSSTAFFAHYTADRFGLIDQLRLASAVGRLHDRKIHFLLTIASTKEARDMFRNYYQKSVTVTRYVSGNRETLRLKELFISNMAITR